MTLMYNLCVCVCVFLHEERPQVACVSSSHCPPFFLRQNFPLNLEFNHLARLASQGAPGVMMILVLAEFIAWDKQKKQLTAWEKQRTKIQEIEKTERQRQ